MDKFGFVAHPIDSQSFYDFLGGYGSVARRFVSDRTLKRFVGSLPPFELCSFSSIRSAQGKSIKGVVASVPLLPAQIATMGEEKALDVVEAAVRLCVRRGARIVGLGGFTSVVGNEGEVLSRRLDVPLTSGNTLTAVLALDGIYKAAYFMGLSLAGATCAVIGATGDIGSIASKVLAKKVKALRIAARNAERLGEFAGELSADGGAAVEVFKYTRDAVRGADIVLSATSSITTIIEPEHLKPGAIVCDVSLPPNIAREVVALRDDILVFEGGLAKMPFPGDIRSPKLRHILPSGSIYGCVAETMTLTFEKRFEPYSIGRGEITEERLDEMRSMAERNGIGLSDFFCGYRFFTEKEIERIRMRADTKKEAYAAQG